MKEKKLEKEKKRWYQKWWGWIIILFFFGIAAPIAIHQSRLTSKNKKILYGIYIIILMFSIFSPKNNRNIENKSQTENKTATVENNNIPLNNSKHVDSVVFVNKTENNENSKVENKENEKTKKIEIETNKDTEQNKNRKEKNEKVEEKNQIENNEITDKKTEEILKKFKGTGYSSNSYNNSKNNNSKTKNTNKKTKNKNQISHAPKTNLFFSSCKEAKSRGYYNIRRGQPGYSSSLDRDDDGIACER